MRCACVAALCAAMCCLTHAACLPCPCVCACTPAQSLVDIMCHTSWEWPDYTTSAVAVALDVLATCPRTQFKYAFSIIEGLLAIDDSLKGMRTKLLLWEVRTLSTMRAPPPPRLAHRTHTPGGWVSRLRRVPRTTWVSCRSSTSCALRAS